jgi:hypothetical protein
VPALDKNAGTEIKVEIEKRADRRLEEGTGRYERKERESGCVRF